jgi:hypothetical protein
MKKNTIVLWVVSLVAMAILAAIVILAFSSTKVYDRCVKYDGRIVDTLGGDTCFANETDIGELKGMQCPCICCVGTDRLQD